MKRFVASSSASGMLTRRFRAPASKKAPGNPRQSRSEEHTSELQSQSNLVCRLLLEKKKKHNNIQPHLIRTGHYHYYKTHSVSSPHRTCPSPYLSNAHNAGRTPPPHTHPPDQLTVSQ